MITEDAARINERIQALGDWRGVVLATVRRLIHEADPAIVETVKWARPASPDGVAVWEHAGIVCTGEIYKDKVKLTFPRGAQLPDPDRLFNAGLAGKVRRAIDIHEGESLDETAFKKLIRAAISANVSRRAGR